MHALRFLLENLHVFAEIMCTPLRIWRSVLLQCEWRTLKCCWLNTQRIYQSKVWMDLFRGKVTFSLFCERFHFRLIRSQTFEVLLIRCAVAFTRMQQSFYAFFFGLNRKETLMTQNVRRILYTALWKRIEFRHLIVMN